MVNEYLSYDEKTRTEISPARLEENKDIQLIRESREIEISHFDGVMARDITSFAIRASMAVSYIKVFLFGKIEQENYDVELGQMSRMKDCGKFRDIEKFYFLTCEPYLIHFISRSISRPSPKELSDCMQIWVKRSGWGDRNPPIANLSISRIQGQRYLAESTTLYDPHFAPPGDKSWHYGGKIELDKLVERIREHEQGRIESEKKSIDSLLNRLRKYEIKTGKKYLL